MPPITQRHLHDEEHRSTQRLSAVGLPGGVLVVSGHEATTAPACSRALGSVASTMPAFSRGREMPCLEDLVLEDVEELGAMGWGCGSAPNSLMKVSRARGVSAMEDPLRCASGST